MDLLLKNEDALLEDPAFVSVEQTGTGEMVHILHGLSGVPTAVFVTPTHIPANTEYNVVEGVHTNKNILLNVTAGVKYKIISWR